MNRLIIYGLLLISFVSKAQEKDKFLPEGNQKFAEKNYVDAEANYRVSKSKFPNRTVAAYNLGNAIYKQNNFNESQGSISKGYLLRGLPGFLSLVQSSKDKNPSCRKFQFLNNKTKQNGTN